jgi:hypothetical protein
MNNPKLNIAIVLKDLAAFDTHIKPIIDNSVKDNYHFYIYHINKYYSPLKKLKSDGNTSFYDLSNYSNTKNSLIEHKINIVISINPGNIFDLFVLSISRTINLPTVYYQHGVQLDFSSFDPKTLSQGTSLNKKISSIKKYLFFYFFFIKNIYFSKKKSYLIKTIKIKTSQLLNKKDLKILPKYGLKENHADYAFVYGRNDKNYLISSMDMNRDNIFISGYPFMPYKKYKNDAALKNEEQEKTALYLSTALRTVGVIPITIEEERSFYLKVYQQVKDAGYKLIIKLHPLEDEDLFRSYFKDKDVEVHRIANLSDLTYESDIIIGEYTTAFFYPIREYKPIIIISSPYFEEYPFDYTRFGIGTKTNVNDLSQTITENYFLTNKNKNSYDIFSKNYINYNKNESSFSQVYKYIEEILKLKK